MPGKRKKTRKAPPNKKEPSQKKIIVPSDENLNDIKLFLKDHFHYEEVIDWSNDPIE